MKLQSYLYFIIISLLLEFADIVTRIPGHPRWIYGEYIATDYLFFPIAWLLIAILTKAGLSYLQRHPKTNYPALNLIVSLFLSFFLGFFSSRGLHKLFIEYPNYKLSAAQVVCEKGTFYKVNRSTGRGGTSSQGVLFLNKNGKETYLTWGKLYRKKSTKQIPVDIKLKRGIFGGLFVVDYGVNLCDLTPKLSLPPKPY